jgi:predicted nucleotidyltransferase
MRYAHPESSLKEAIELLTKKLSNDLIDTGKFTKSREPQRFLFNNNTPIDFIPFGTIENKSNQIIWPPGDEVILNVLGFEEAYKNAIMAR